MMCECTNTYSDGTTKTEEGASTILFGDANSCYCGGINSVVRTAVNVLTVGIGLLGTLGIVWSGVVYMSARDDESQVAKAKKRLIQTLIGIAAVGLFDAAVFLLMPGGTASNIPTVVSSTSEIVARPEPEKKPDPVPTTPSTPLDAVYAYRQ